MSGCFVVIQILLLMALVRVKSSGIVLPPPDNLARLTDLLHARNVVIFCPLWGPSHLKQIAHQLRRAIRLNPESAPFGKGPTSLLTCPGQFLNRSQFLDVLNKQSEIVSIAPRIVLYQSESDLGILDSISEIPINHPIYLYNVDTMVLWELYSLSGVRYRNEVGSFDPGNGTALRLTMNALKDDRRNLQGLHFKVFVEVQAPFMLPKENYPSLTSNDDPDIIDVTGKFKGLFIDVLDIISRELNFTYSLKRRKDMVWGNYVDGNWTGMIKSILEGEGDFIGSCLTLDLSRFAGVDFLNPIATQAEAIFIKNTKKEAFSWDLFYSPLTPNSWLAMVAIAAFIALTVRGIKNYQQKMNDLSLAQELLFFIRCFVRTSGTYFGGTDLAKSDQVSSLRFVVFCVILSGNVVFISYQASLTSALSVIQSVRPFSSLQGLLDSEYRIAITGGTLQSNLFQLSEPGTIFNDLYNTKMRPFDDDETYQQSNKEGINLLLSSSEKIAYFDDLEGMSVYPETRNCEVTSPWQNKFPKYMSFAFPKGSPYTVIFNGAIFQLYETGVINLLKSQWEKESINCFSQSGGAEATAIGFEKIVSLFGMLGFFVFFALILLCFEFLIILGCGERKRNFKKKEDSDVLERFKKRNDAIWKANIAPLEISRRLRYLANDIELARTKSDIDKIRINHFVVRYE